MQIDAMRGPKAHAHVVQFYNDDAVLAEGCAKFIGAALAAGDAAVVIANRAHREGITSRLKATGVDAAQGRQQGCLVMLDAEETLKKFMVEGAPDAARFEETIGSVIDQARTRGTNPEKVRVRAFGEMVAILWSKGEQKAAIELEKLWNELARKKEFSLRCAYPMAGFAHGKDNEAFLQICAEHGEVIPTEAYTDLTGEAQRLVQIASLQQRAEALAAEIAAREQAQAELEESQAELERLIEKRTASLRDMWIRVIRAQDEERRRVSRDLHERIGQSLAAAKMSVAHLRQRIESRTPDAFAQLDGILDACLQETRTLSYLLHPPILDEVGLLSAVKWYAEEFANRSGIRVRVSAPADAARLPLVLETALFRILQETLTNVHRHAKADDVDVWLEMNDREAILEIRDYGNGIPPELMKSFRSNGAGIRVGLAGIRERAAEFGGRVDLERANPGTRLRAVIPIFAADCPR